MGIWDMVFSLRLSTVNHRHLTGQIQTQTKSDLLSGPFQYVRTGVCLIRLPRLKTHLCKHKRSPISVVQLPSISPKVTLNNAIMGCYPSLFFLFKMSFNHPQQFSKYTGMEPRSG